MPSSTWVHTSYVSGLIAEIKPKTILDLGIGFGRWGFLCREILDVFQGRMIKETWQAKIIGVEIFEGYLGDAQQAIYEKIEVVDAITYLVGHQGDVFDLIIAGDILEHYPKELGHQLLDQVYRVASKAAIICVPIGNKYPQKACLGNPYEEHKSVWEATEFQGDKRFTKLQCFTEAIKGRPYLVALMDKRKA